ncbi:MAG: ABC transporter substrate-binding protein [Magnetococcales bacterium]|nr:ABC transporter substrate-binding protein [Magnetococcales bacterium]
MSTSRFRLLVVVCSLLLSAIFFLPVSVKAEGGAPAGAMASLRQTIEQVIDILKDPQYSTPERRVARRDAVKKLIYKQFNFHLMARGAVGPRWKEYAPPQQERFGELFKRVLEDAYLAKIEGYQGEKVGFNKEVAESPTITRVESVVHAKGQEYAMHYRLTPGKDGRWEVFDVIIEGVSLVNNYRSQFQPILSKDGPAGLLAKMESKFGSTEGSAASAASGLAESATGKQGP